MTTGDTGALLLRPNIYHVIRSNNRLLNVNCMLMFSRVNNHSRQFRLLIFIEDVFPTQVRPMREPDIVFILHTHDYMSFQELYSINRIQVALTSGG